MDTRKLLLISKLAIVLVLVYTGGAALMVHRDSREFLVPASAGGGGREGVFQADSEADSAADDLSWTVQAEIFGSQPGPGKGGSQHASASKELGIELVGTIAGKPAVSVAFIKNTKTKSLGLYRIGQAVAGATIESIRLNAVDLLHNGRVKTLTIKTARTRGHIGSSRPSKGKTQASRSAAPYLPTSRATSNSAAVGRSKAAYVEEILSKAVIEPYAVNGKVEGLKVTGLAKVPAAVSLGLRDGDVVRHVNGQQLTSLQKAFQVFQKAKSQPAVNLQLSRDGEIKELTFDLH